MSKLNVEKGSLNNFTSISNIFLEKYMPGANGDFVKIYLYLLRCSSSPYDDLSISRIADVLNYTEKDILRALSYWEQTGLLSLSYDSANHLTGIRFEEYSHPAAPIKSGNGLTVSLPDTGQSAVKEKSTYSKKDLERFLAKEDISQLLYIVQKYLGKTLSPSETNTLLYFYDELNFSVELIEYLIEYCVSKDHKSMRYIEKVAVSWAENNITTIEKAKEMTSIYNKNVFSVLKAFGISGRGPGEAEKAFIVKWTDSYGFNLDIILDACNRTIHSIHQPSFEYADSILKTWKDKGIKHLTDVKALDDAHEKNKARKPEENRNKVTLQSSKNNFNSFSQRTYNYAELEKHLLNNN